MLALTNSLAHFRELDEAIIASANATVGATELRSRASLTLFNAEGAPPELEAQFAEVVAHEFAAELVIDRVEPLLAYAASMGVFVAGEPSLRTVVLEELERRLAGVIAAEGAFRITTACACFVCR